MNWFQLRLKTTTYGKIFVYNFIKKISLLIIVGLILYSIKNGWLIFEYFKEQHYVYSNSSYIHRQILTFFIILVIIFFMKSSYNHLTRIIKQEETNLTKMKKGFKAEKLLYNFLKNNYNKKDGLKLKKNIILTSKNSKFDLDFALIDETRKIFYAFECKSYNNVTIQEDGSLEVKYYDKIKTYNPEFQLLSTIKAFKEHYPKYKNYYFVPIVALPYCKQFVPNQKSKVYYWIGLNSQILNTIIEESKSSRKK